MKKGYGTAMKIKAHMGSSENYSRLFGFICEMDGEVQKGKLFPTHPGFEGGSWSFAVFSPDMVAALYPFTPAMDPHIRQAYEEKLGLLEIYSGDYMAPRYIALTPGVNVDELKQEWRHDYCAFHNLDIRKTGEETGVSETA